MADVTPKWDATRIFILVIVVVFAVSSLALSIWVIWEQVRGKDDSTATDTSQTEQVADGSCTMDQPVAAALPAPEVFKPAGDVTELQKTDLEPGTGDAV